MKIVVLNGSPKGKNSVTLQTVLYLEKAFTDDEFEILDIGQKIKMYEKNMKDVVQSLKNADLILFSYPVYTFIAPYQLHRFIELLKLQSISFKNKFATQITTSKHFYDVTAHNYIEENCFDINLKFIKGLSADMDDLLSKKGQVDAIKFWNYVRFSVKNNLSETMPRTSSPKAVRIYNKAFDNTPKKNDFDTVIVTNCEKNDINLKNMIEDFQNIYPYSTRIVNIKEYPFSGGCLGCFKCASTGKCIYKDNFDTFLREKIQKASAIIYAFTIKDHSMGASFKIYDDRQFCNGHRTVTVGTPMGYIISGEYSKERNLKTIIEGRCEVGHSFLTGVATDENDTSTELYKLSIKTAYALEHKLLLPANFLGVGGMKIFRDLIYVMRGIMKEDHRFYKKNGIYDFPQKQVGTIIKMKFAGTLMSIPGFEKKAGNKMNDAIVSPYKKVINSAPKES